MIAVRNVVFVNEVGKIYTYCGQNSARSEGSWQNVCSGQNSARSE